MLEAEPDQPQQGWGAWAWGVVAGSESEVTPSAAAAVSTVVNIGLYFDRISLTLRMARRRMDIFSSIPQVTFPSLVTLAGTGVGMDVWKSAATGLMLSAKVHSIIGEHWELPQTHVPPRTDTAPATSRGRIASPVLTPATNDSGHSRCFLSAGEEAADPQQHLAASLFYQRLAADLDTSTEEAQAFVAEEPAVTISFSKPPSAPNDEESPETLSHSSPESGEAHLTAEVEGLDVLVHPCLVADLFAVANSCRKTWISLTGKHENGAPLFRGRKRADNAECPPSLTQTLQRTKTARYTILVRNSKVGVSTSRQGRVSGEATVRPSETWDRGGASSSGAVALVLQVQSAEVEMRLLQTFASGLWLLLPRLRPDNSPWLDVPSALRPHLEGSVQADLCGVTLNLTRVHEYSTVAVERKGGTNALFPAPLSAITTPFDCSFCRTKSVLPSDWHVTTPAVRISVQLPLIEVSCRQTDAEKIIGVAAVWSRTIQRDPERDFAFVEREASRFPRSEATADACVRLLVTGCTIDCSIGAVLALKGKLDRIVAKMTHESFIDLPLVTAPAPTGQVYLDVGRGCEEPATAQGTDTSLLRFCLQLPRSRPSVCVASTPPVVAATLQGLAVNFDPLCVRWIKDCALWASRQRFRPPSGAPSAGAGADWGGSSGLQPGMAGMALIRSPAREQHSFADSQPQDSDEKTPSSRPAEAAIWNARSLLLNVVVAPAVVLWPAASTVRRRSTAQEVQGEAEAEDDSVLGRLWNRMQAEPAGVPATVNVCFPAINVQSADVAQMIHPNANIPVSLDVLNTMPWSAELHGFAVRTIMPATASSPGSVQQTILHCEAVNASIVDATQKAPDEVGSREEQSSSVAAHVSCQPVMLSFTREQTTMLQSLFAKADGVDDASIGSGSTTEPPDDAFLRRRFSDGADTARQPSAPAKKRGRIQRFLRSMWRHRPSVWVQATLPNVQFLATAEGGPQRNRQRIVAELEGLSASFDVQRSVLTADFKLGDLFMNHEIQRSAEGAWTPGVCDGILAITYQATDLAAGRRADRAKRRQTAWLTAKAVLQLEDSVHAANDQVG